MDSWYFQPEEDPFCSPEGTPRSCTGLAPARGGRAQPGEPAAVGAAERGKNDRLARKGLLLKSAKPFYPYSESLLLILTSWIQRLISKSPSTL